ncbi:MtrB/PioB family decaheme-associated outer membrane protein [Afifella sp. H1R]|uniref:MtrB/PioB family decaheme-associated outer membrane protein n=1 Tax=Afifella sp. H1R TaxID=2908841 RepID=UPI001F1E1B25|nr:MtrB/PioB family decaheme-associated outer membrane protein [Afifella sp. H1R]MCF1503507.1 MtrB/PioB family decaheme-associated outer membrane protein [Afifella sp. H1R]
MKVQRRLTLATMALLAGGAALPQAAKAQDDKDTEAVTWGEIEMGARVFIDEPPDHASVWDTPSILAPQKYSSAKFEEYGDVPSGLLLEKLMFGWQSGDGLYSGEVRAENIGQNNGRYIFDWSRTGLLDGTFMWDEIPHLYSTTAQSIWQGVGTDFLSTDVSFPESPPSPAEYDAAISGAVHPIDIGIDRRRIQYDQTYTPSPSWEFEASYLNDHREGTQPAGILMNGFGAGEVHRVDVPRPVDDVTQNLKASGEYFSKTPWGGRFNVSVTGHASTYENKYDSYTFQNPYYQVPGTTFPQFGRVSLAPDNEAYSLGVTTGVDLPWKSRYMGTVSYTTMEQTDTLIPYTINPNAPALSLPTTDARAKINTLLINNKISTQIAEDVSTTLRYRYYDLDNRTPEWLIDQYIMGDSTTATPATGGLRALAYQYTKQNASAEVSWLATSRITLGSEFGWERWDRDRRSVNVTDEYLGKITLDARITDRAQLRSSYQYSQRRYDSYDLGPVLDAMVSDPLGTNVDPGVRKYDMADRDRHKAKVSLEYEALENLVITPSFGLRFDDYLTDPAIPEYGLLKDNSWDGGLEVAFSPAPGISLMAAYVYEDFDRDMVGASITGGGTDVVTGGWDSKMTEQVHTLVAGANIEIIPGVLDLEFYDSFARGVSKWTATASSRTPIATPLCPGDTNCLPFPDMVTNYNRFDAALNYHPEAGGILGLDGDLTLTLKYSWERNFVDNWQDELDTPYQHLIEDGVTTSYAMGFWDTNYNVHAVMASLVYRW